MQQCYIMACGPVGYYTKQPLVSNQGLPNVLRMMTLPYIRHYWGCPMLFITKITPDRTQHVSDDMISTIILNERSHRKSLWRSFFLRGQCRELIVGVVSVESQVRALGPMKNLRCRMAGLR
ncbi:hypothetical protein TNCV_2200501 [Trichonephila clavipes]|nr:hypothetical protein TNCV_2200501 [Trichonephila clavipes]